MTVLSMRSCRVPLRVPATMRLLAAGSLMLAWPLVSVRTVAANTCPTGWSLLEPIGVTGSHISAMIMWDEDGNGPAPAKLVVGGRFSALGGVAAANIAMWDGATWSPIGSRVNGDVWGLAVLPDGRLVVGGLFTAAGATPVSGIAQFTSGAWAPVGTGVSGGFFGLSGVFSFAVAPNGDLFAGGIFTSAGGVPANCIARWDGTSWSSLGSGVTGGTDVPLVVDLAMKPDGSLIAAGRFTHAGGVTVNYIAQWNGTAWNSFGTGLDQEAHEVELLPDGDVVVGGSFFHAGGVAASNIARWNGSAWSPLGSGMSINGIPYVFSLARGLDGTLYAGGGFSSAGGMSASNIAKWDGASWSALGSGTDGESRALLILPSGELIVGGPFTQAGGLTASRIARFGPTGLAPSILTEPSPNAYACANDGAELSLVASSAAPLSFEWQIEATAGVWIPLGSVPAPVLACSPVTSGAVTATPPNAATTSIRVASCSAASSWRVRAVVSNACGTVISESATVSICPADFGCDGSVDVADLFDFLDAWFAQNGQFGAGLTADFIPNGEVTPSDLFLFLDAWFAQNGVCG